MARRLDLDLCWKEAMSLLRSNRDITIALGGVFLFLPSLTFGFLVPEPLAGDTSDLKAAWAAQVEFFRANYHWLFLVSLIGALGTLTLLTVLLRRSKPSVGEALGGSLKLVLPYLIANLLAGMATGIGVLLFVIPGIYVYIRFLLTGPVMANEAVGNPLTALKRSWALTTGNVARMGLFLLIILITAYVIFFVTSAVLGAVLVLALGADGSKLPILIVSTLLGTIISVLFICVHAALYRQLQQADTPDAMQV